MNGLEAGRNGSGLGFCRGSKGTISGLPKRAAGREASDAPSQEINLMEKFDPDFSESPTPHLFIQWKGTDLCGDFRCECGNNQHIDAMFCYTIECDECGAKYKTPHTVGLVRIATDTDRPPPSP